MKNRSRTIRMRIHPIIAIPFAAIVATIVMITWCGVSPASTTGKSEITPSENLSPDKEVQLSKIATRLFELPSDLQIRFPKSFGGIRAVDNSNLVIAIVDDGSGDGSRLKEYVQSIVADSLNTVGRSTTFTFEQTRVSFQHRIDIQQEILEHVGNGGEFSGLGVTSVGLNADGITVGTSNPRLPVEKELSSAYPEIQFTVRDDLESTAVASRFADSAPWNGGDELAINFFGSAVHRCTSGPGAHNNSGARFLLAAGHCGSNSYYNTSFGTPLLNNPVGSTVGSIFSDGYPDIQIISANSSRYFWEGPGYGTRRTTLAPVDPVVGYTVCGQGVTTAAWGATNCGIVSQVNMTNTPVFDPSSGIVTYVSGLFLWDGSAALAGDSGGYISLSTIYGFGAVGTITSSNPNGTPRYTTGIPVAFHNFIWGLTLNTPSNP